MKKKMVLFSKIFGYALFFIFIFIASIFFTMSYLIKGEEVKSPPLIGLSLNDAYKIAAENSIYLKKIYGNYDKSYKPMTVIDQFPSPGVKVKEKSFIKIFVTSEQKEVTVPDLSGNSLKECEKLLVDHDLKKRFVSYIDTEDIPVDFVVSQSIPAGANVISGSVVDLLISKGKRNKSFVMPDLIGKNANNVRFFFETKGLQITNITPVSYPGIDPGIIIKQFPDSGFRINAKNLINIWVSE